MGALPGCRMVAHHLFMRFLPRISRRVLAKSSHPLYSFAAFAALVRKKERVLQRHAALTFLHTASLCVVIVYFCGCFRSTLKDQPFAIARVGVASCETLLALAASGAVQSAAWRGMDGQVGGRLFPRELTSFSCRSRRSRLRCIEGPSRRDGSGRVSLRLIARPTPAGALPDKLESRLRPSRY